MSEQKSLDMSKFVNSGFDCEFFDSPDSEDREIGMFSSGEVLISPLCKISTYQDGKDFWYQYDRNGFRLWKENCRPRLNKPQVIKDFRAVLVDGLVWRAQRFIWGEWEIIECARSNSIREAIWDSFESGIFWLECLGLEDIPEWQEESMRLGIPLINTEKLHGGEL